MNWVYGIKIAGLIIGIGLVVALIIILLSKYFKHRKRKIELRKAARLSQSDLAKFAGCTQAAISKYEQGQRKIPYDERYK